MRTRSIIVGVVALTFAFLVVTLDADAKPLYLCGDSTPVLLTDRAELALSRIVTSTNLCEGYLTKQVYPRF